MSQRKQSPRTTAAIALIIGALYAPQSWFLCMNYPWNGYRLSWLKLWPGLPTFFPVVVLTHPHNVHMIMSLWGTTALLAMTLFFLRKRSPIVFWIALACALTWSIVSAIGAHALFTA